MFDFETGERIWIAVAGEETAGVIVDPRRAARDIPVSRRRDPSGAIHAQDTVVAISYRQPPNGEPFYTERPEVALYVRPRVGAPVPEIDDFSIAELKEKVYLDALALQRRRLAAQPVTA